MFPPPPPPRYVLPQPPDWVVEVSQKSASICIQAHWYGARGGCASHQSEGVGAMGSSQSGTERAAGLLSRKDAAQFLGMSRSGLRNLDGVQLTPINIGPRGDVFYKREELEGVLVHRLGSQSATAFKHFEDGGTPVELVTEHGIDHVAGLRLYEAWKRLKLVAGCCLFIELPLDITSRPWRATYGFDDTGVPPLWALRAIELVAMTPELRARVDRVTSPAAVDPPDD